MSKPKLVTCNRCGTTNLSWVQDHNGRWSLTSDNGAHKCESAESKTVKCKYCPANDLHWMKEPMPDLSLIHI